MFKANVKICVTSQLSKGRVRPFKQLHRVTENAMELSNVPLNVPHKHCEIIGTAHQQVARLVQTTSRTGEIPTQQQDEGTTSANGG